MNNRTLIKKIGKFKKLNSEQISKTIPDPEQPFCAMFDAISTMIKKNESNFSKITNFYTSRTTTLYTYQRMYSHKKTHSNRTFDAWSEKVHISIFRSQTNNIPLYTKIIFKSKTKKISIDILLKLLNLPIGWMSQNHLSIPDTLSRNTQPEKHHQSY